MWGRGNRNRGGYRGGNRGNRGWGGGNTGSRRHFGNQNHRGAGGNWGRERGDKRHHSNRVKPDMPTKRLSEEEIGVTEYMSTHKGFSGIIKARYSDFQVAEINEKGEIAELTSFEVPQPPVVDTEVVEDEELFFSKYNLEILPMDTWDRINTLAVSREPSEERVEIDVTGMTKEQRTKIHDAVKKAFRQNIVGSTVTIGSNEEEKKFVRFEKYRKGVRIDNRIKWRYPAEYVYFIVHKENCDTMEAASRIADALRMNLKPAMLGYAGTKDRRAKTSQWFSVRRIDPQKISNAVRNLQNIHVGNYTFHNNQLKLGMLKGNQFRIALRNVTGAAEEVEAACGQLRARGFVNYYGLQRFGARAHVPTYCIGRYLLQGKLKEAIDSILDEREGPLEEACRKYKESGADVAVRHLPYFANKAPIETKLLRSLANEPNDLLGAINKLPRNTRLLYLHAYQSLVWNKAVSRRLQLYGTQPAVGDLVYKDRETIDDEIINENDEDNDNQDDSEDSSLNVTESDVEDPKNVTEQLQRTSPKKDDIKDSENRSAKVRMREAIKILTQEDVDSGKYTIFDVIMPLPGYLIEYPSNMKEYYEELLTADGLTLNLKHKIKSFSLSGAYRRVCVRAGGLAWAWRRYSAPHADLLLSDADRAAARRLPDAPDGLYKALILTFTLPPSCYATMALRELLKIDTSSDNQASLNNYHKENTDMTDKKRKLEEEANENKRIKVESTNKEVTESNGKVETVEVTSDTQKIKVEKVDADSMHVENNKRVSEEEFVSETKRVKNKV